MMSGLPEPPPPYTATDPANFTINSSTPPASNLLGGQLNISPAALPGAPLPPPPNVPLPLIPGPPMPGQGPKAGRRRPKTNLSSSEDSSAKNGASQQNSQSEKGLAIKKRAVK